MNSYILIICSFIFITGCSVSNRISNYPSKEEYYNKINSYLKNKPVSVIIKKDSILYSSDVTIKNNEIDAVERNISRIERTVLIKDIKLIEYTSNNLENLSGNLLLSTGERIYAENIKPYNDSLHFLNIKQDFLRVSIPLSQVESLRIKNNFYGALNGFSIGIIGGAAGGLALIHTGRKTASSDKAMGTIGGALVGCITGAIIGYIIGSNEYFYFK